MTDRIDRIAQAIKTAHETAEPFRNLDGDLAPTDIPEAYAAQFRLHDLHVKNGRGALGGRKIALASKVQQELCGIDHPIAGAIFANEIMASPVAINLADYHGLGVEFELAIMLADDLTGALAPFSKDTISRHIASVHPAYELIIDRNADYNILNALTMIADNAWCAGVILGPEIPDWRALDLDELPVTLHWNDEAPVPAKTGLADPLGSLAWVASLITGMGGTIHAGDIVITGSVIKTRYPEPGDRMRYDIDGRADVVLTIS